MWYPPQAASSQIYHIQIHECTTCVTHVTAITGIYDLLNLRAKNLPVKWDTNLGFNVPGLKAVDCNSFEAMLEVRRTEA